MPRELQHAIEAAAVTAIGACTAYWFAPLFGGRHTPANVSELQAMLFGAVVAAVCYCVFRLAESSHQLKQQ